MRWSLTHEDIPMEEERPVCLPLSELVDSDDSGARPAACHGRTSRCNVCGRILLQCRARLTRCRCSIAEEIGGGCTGQMARAKQPPGESGLSASLPPFSSTSLIGGAEERLFCRARGASFFPADQSSLVHLGEASGKQALAASKTKRRKTSSAHTELATMETEMRNLTLKRNRLLTTK